MRILKILAMAAAAGALKAISDMLPSVLPAGVGNLVAVAIAAAIGYALPAPQATRRKS
jgi:hypothetical protein